MALPEPSSGRSVRSVRTVASAAAAVAPSLSSDPASSSAHDRRLPSSPLQMLSSSGGDRRDAPGGTARRGTGTSTSRLPPPGQRDRRTRRQLIKVDDAEHDRLAPLAYPLSPPPTAMRTTHEYDVPAVTTVLRETERFRLSIAAPTAAPLATKMLNRGRAAPLPAAKATRAAAASVPSMLTLNEAHKRALGGPTLRQAFSQWNARLHATAA
jgi:hypothetical protein